MITVLANLSIFGRQFELHSLIGASLLTIAGTQVVGLGLCARAYGYFMMNERSPVLDRFRLRFKLEDILLAGAAVLLVGLAAMVYVAIVWANGGFGALAR